MAPDWSGSDAQSFLSTVADATQAISVILAPRTRDEIRRAIDQRVSLREEAIPNNLSSVKDKLLNLEPLSPFPYGTREGVADIWNARPIPATVLLKGPQDYRYQPRPGPSSTRPPQHKGGSAKSFHQGGAGNKQGQRNSQAAASPSQQGKSTFHNKNGGSNKKGGSKQSGQPHSQDRKGNKTE